MTHVFAVATSYSILPVADIDTFQANHASMAMEEIVFEVAFVYAFVLEYHFTFAVLYFGTFSTFAHETVLFLFGLREGDAGAGATVAVNVFYFVFRKLGTC